MRLEKGYRVWGSDITPETTPDEAGLSFAVRAGQGDFLGRAALLAARAADRRRAACAAWSWPTRPPSAWAPNRSGSTASRSAG